MVPAVPTMSGLETQPGGGATWPGRPAHTSLFLAGILASVGVFMPGPSINGEAAKFLGPGSHPNE